MERWKSEWQSIDARIAGLQPIASMVLTASDMHSNGLAFEELCRNALTPPLIEIVGSLEEFKASHVDVLPQVAARHMNEGLGRVRSIIGGFAARDLRWQGAVSAAATLMGLRLEILASLADVEVVGRQRTERALEHLQRLIVVDNEHRKRWMAARNEGEEECERLGEVHLLLHGIWAFKAYSSAERTDLIAQEKLALTRSEKRIDLVTQAPLVMNRTVEAAEALVLTEWKLVGTRDQVAEMAELHLRLHMSDRERPIELGAGLRLDGTTLHSLQTLFTPIP